MNKQIKTDHEEIIRIVKDIDYIKKSILGIYFTIILNIIINLIIIKT